MKKLGVLKTIGMSAFCLLLITNAHAQEGKRERKGDQKTEAPDPIKMAERQTDKLSKELSLNEATRTKVAELNKEYARKMADVAKVERERREKERVKMQAIHKEREAKLKSVLSKEEYDKYEEMKASKKAEMAERRAHPRHRRGQRH